MIDDLAGRVAVVTGAASGIGRALATRLAAEGARVVAADIDTAGLDTTVGAIVGAGDVARAHTVDVADAASVDALAADVFANEGGVDVLCLNAGVFRGGPLWERPLDEWHWVLDVNLYGVIHGVRAFVPAMVERAEPARVVITASMGGLVAGPFAGVYYTSKFAAVGLAESLAHDLAAVGSPVGVSVLVPSLVDTQIGSSTRNRSEPFTADAGAAFVEEQMRASTAAGLDPAEVAGCVVDAVRAGEFLVPTKASYREQMQRRHDALVERTLPPWELWD